MGHLEKFYCLDSMAKKNSVHFQIHFLIFSGRLKVTTIRGDIDGDGEFEELYPGGEWIIGTITYSHFSLKATMILLLELFNSQTKKTGHK